MALPAYMTNPNGRLTAPQEYEATFRQLRTSNEATIETAERLARIRRVNGLDAIIAATAAGAFVAGTSMTREEFLIAVRLMESLYSWLTTPLGPGLPTPEQAIFHRDPPAAEAAQ